MYRVVAAAALFVLAIAMPAVGQVPPNQPASFPSGPNPHAVTTFHSIGVYWHVPGGSGSAQVEYKEASSSTWIAGHEATFDARNNEYRGSIVEVKPGTTYDIRLTAGSQVTLQTTTWKESFPVPAGYTINIQPGVKTVQIWSANVALPFFTVTGSHQDIRVPQNATAQQYTLVTAPAGQLLDQTGGASNGGSCIAIVGGTRYLIIRGVTMVNCTLNGILLARFSTPTRSTSDIVIEDNDISAFGPAPSSQTFGGINCGFYWETSDSLRPTRIIMQRNRIHDPKFGSTNWTNDPSHPRGVNGLYFNHCGTNHVVRYNEIYSTGPNYFMDGIGGAENASRESDGFTPFHYAAGSGTEGFGFPWADSDIYGNRVTHAYDDAIEAEGANRNVRIWGNYMDKVGIGIANATTGMGPLYVWRNVSNLLANMKCPAPCDPDNTEDRGPFVKAGKTYAPGTIPSLNGGRSYYYHNTVLQPDIGTSYPGGAGYGIGNAGGNLYNIVSLNNIWHIHKPLPGPGNDFWSILANCNLGPCSAEYDVYNGRVELVPGTVAPEPNGFPGVPTYAGIVLPVDGSGAWTGSADFTLATTSLGYRAGTFIPNFSRYASPDVGAHQTGTAPMLFGVRACYPSGGAANISCQQP
jgi:hypothetical protein